MLLNEHVYCVAIIFKMTEQICIKFCIKLEHSFAETIWVTQKATAIGNWYDWQLHHDNTATHASRLMQSILAKHQITQVTQHPYSPDLAPCNFWLFPKLKSLWKGKDFRLSMRFRKIWLGSWWRLGGLCEVPRYSLWRGLRCHCPVYSVSCIFLNKCLYFSCYMAGYLLDRPHTRKCFMNHLFTYPYKSINICVYIDYTYKWNL